MITHMVQRVRGLQDLETKLDNAANRGWVLVGIIPVNQNDANHEVFFVIHKKKEVDDD